jgi:tetratricopeptide (TPR) repeat protein/serine/threonine protein kinase
MTEREIFLAALKQPTAGERAAFLDQACGSDAKLRGQIEALLAEHEQLGSYLEAPVAAGQRTLDEAPATERSGTIIGPYKLVEPIGEGGMGTVWMAQQTVPVKRLVAVKLIKAGMDSKQVIARFEAERQALALMDHSNISRVLDGGTTDAGRPYFVMDLVKGVPITRYCDQHRLTPRQRLDLFVPVCHAVQHAHQKGIIHRDLKPSNVLVAHYDGKPVPKVIDFGVAKAAGQSLTDKTLVTGFGAIVGTLEYMSPEQAEVNQLDIDTRSDIYSLGVLLYELLTGGPPFSKQDLEKAGMLEMLRVIREQEPSKPSTKLSTADGLPTLAANRGTEPAKLTKLVRGELDWIVMKALEKDRNRRYETANGFAIDVQRYLADEPVQACPPSVGYRLRKFARRNKGPVLAASLVALALIGGVIGTTWGMFRATEAEADAKREAGEKTVALSEKVAALATAKANETAAKLAQKDAQENLKDALAAVDQMLTRVAEDKLLYVPQMEPIRRDLLLDALKFYQKFLEKQSDDPVIRREALLAYRRVGRIHAQRGQFQDAVRAYRNAIEMFDKLGPAAFADPVLLREMSSCQIECSWPLDELGDAEEAVQKIRRAVELAVKLDEIQPGNRPHLVNARIFLARTLISQQPDEAEKILKANLELADDDISRQGVHAMRGAMFRATRRLAQAEESYREALKCAEHMARENPTVNWVQHVLACDQGALAGVIAADQRWGEAEEIQRRAVRIMDKLASDFSNSLTYRRTQADFLIEHAGFLKQLRRTADAEKVYRRAVDLYEKLAADFPSLPIQQQIAFDQRLSLSQFLVEAGRIEDALDVYHQAIDRSGKQARDFPSKLNHWQGLVRSQVELGRLLANNGKKEEAEAAYRRAVEIQEKLEKDFAGKPEDRRELAQNHYQAATLFIGAGRPREAERLYELWRPHSEPELERLKKAAEADPKNGLHWGSLAIACYRAGKWQDALDLFKTKEHLGYGIGGSAWQWFYIAMAHWKLGHKEKAHSWYYQSIDWVERGHEKGLAGVQAEAAALMGLPDPGERSEQAWTYSQTGTDLEKQGQMDKAMEAYSRAIDLYEKLRVDFPTVPAYRTRLDDLLSKKNIVGLRKAIELDPKSADAHNRLGQALRTQGKLDETIACHRKAIELDPKLAQAHKDLGHALFDQQKLAEAVAEYRRAVVLAPKDAGAHSDLGNALFVQKKLDDAIAAYRTAVELAPKNVIAHAWLGYALEVQGKLHEAIACYRRALEVNPKYAWAHNALGRMGWYLANHPDPKVRDLKRAVELGTEAVEHVPQSIQAWQNLGWIQYRAGNWKASVEALEKSCALQKGGDCGQWIVLALAHWKLASQPGLAEPEQAGHRQKAQTWYDQAVKQIDGHPGLKDGVGQAIRAFRAEAAEWMGIKEKQK